MEYNEVPLDKWTSVGEKKLAVRCVEKREHTFIAGGKVKAVQPLWETVWQFFKTLNTGQFFRGIQKFHS